MNKGIIFNSSELIRLNILDEVDSDGLIEISAQILTISPEEIEICIYII